MKKVMMQKISLQILLLFAPGVLMVKGQNPSNELTLYGGGGLAAYHFLPPIKNASSIGYGGDAGVEITRFFNQKWGFQFGVGLDYFNVKNKLTHSIFITPDQKDCEDNPFDLYTTLYNYKEGHKAFSLAVPLMLHYQKNMNQSVNSAKNEKVGYYAMAGVKTYFPFVYNYSLEIESFNNAGYYPQFDNWIYSLPVLGLGTFDASKLTGKRKIDIMPFLALEAGVKWRMNSGYLYTGLYFDYGLYNPTMKDRVPYSEYIHPKQLGNITLLKFTDRMNLMAAGIKIRFAFYQTQNEAECTHKWWNIKKYYK